MKDHAFTAQIRRRIFDVVPAATWQMEQLLSLLDITADDSVPTACVDCAARPRLRLNPKFVAEHCRTDEHLLMLVLHELHHVVLGHTRLFARPTLAHNIAFDAVINAMLCVQFGEERYTSFFTQINDDKTFPARLLRPPVGWPRETRFAKGISRTERRVMSLLYGPKDGGITYLEVFELLLEELSKADAEGFVLVGNHSDQGDAAENDPLFGKAIRKIVSQWPRPARVLEGRDEGGKTDPWRLQPADNAPRRLREAVGKLLRQAGVYDGAGQRTHRRVPVVLPRIVETVVPQARDRRLPAWRSLHGTWPVIFRGAIEERRLARQPQPVAHVYLDVSGSMNSVLPVLAAALERPHRAGLVRLYVFSTVVGEISPKEMRGQVPNTLGTDINCVLRHLAGFPLRQRPRRAVLLTDGYVGEAQRLLVDQLDRVRFYAGLTEKGPCDYLSRMGARLTHLPI